MNKYYNYPGIELWNDAAWTQKQAPLYHLIEKIMQDGEIRESSYVPSYDYDPAGDLTKHPLYRHKTHGIDDPAVVKELEQKGLTYLCTGQGGNQNQFERCWFCIAPQKAVDDWKKLTMLIAFDRENEHSPLWTMRAVTRYQKYIDMLAASMDFLFVVLVNETPDYDKIYFNILQEISILFPCDITKMYLDVSQITARGKLADVEGFRFVDLFGKESDPDAAVMKFGSLSVPVLNIAGHWGNGDSLGRGLVMHFQMNAGRFDREWLVHSGVGRRMAEGLRIENDYNYVEDPALIAEMEGRGLIYKVCYSGMGDRYIIAAPRQAVEEKEKLPVVLVFQEVYGGNEHLAVTANSYDGEWLDIAAQGECFVIYFVLEDIVSNDRAIDIIRKLSEEYALDLSRVYVTGHSHDGYFSYAFANRNPDFVTAIAPQGMGPCPVGMNEVPDYSGAHRIAEYDIPEISLTGLCESQFPKDEEDKKGRWVDMWKFIMRNFNVPEKSSEQILAAFDSSCYTERTTCIAGDRFETRFADGVEHYIVDFINREGKNHLRIVRSQNMPHTVTPYMIDLSWEFLRRFRRDPETKKIVEIR